ncbi:hypothetical protein [uncultured Rubinisphaera sp.]|uniref:hypothetical protein n=1 Tax=uncultured Rubinisphaera sp. TaxID=1678686 RepID=UPI0030DCD864
MSVAGIENTTEDLPEIPTLRFTPDLTRSIAVLVFSVLFLAIGIELVKDGVLEGLLLVVLFSLAIVACLSVILPGACFVEIDPEEITISSSFRRKVYRWDQVERIGIFEVGIIRRIGVDLNAKYPGPERVPNYMKSASGFHISLPSMSGMEPDGLLEVMQKCFDASVNRRLEVEKMKS